MFEIFGRTIPVSSFGHRESVLDLASSRLADSTSVVAKEGAANQVLMYCQPGAALQEIFLRLKKSFSNDLQCVE